MVFAAMTRLVPACFFLFATIALAPRALAQEDDRFKAEYARARELLAAEKYHDALKSFEKADKLAGGKCGPCRFEMAKIEMKSGSYDDSVRDADKAIANLTDPMSLAIVHNLKGVILMGLADGKMDKLQKAQAEFQAARQLNGDDPTFLLNLGMVKLKMKDDEAGIALLKEFLAQVPDGIAAQTARRFIEKPRRARESFAPALTVTTLQGEKYSLDAMAGKVVVIDFWATWCPPCVESVPELKELLKKYPREKVSLISISADDDDEKWRNFIAEKHMGWPHYRDEGGAIEEAFGVHAFPTYLVIDGDGIIRQRIEGADQQRSVASLIAPTVEKILKSPGGVLSKEK
jgi:thiol-disulfide isomerase/thioredoxin